MRPLIAAVLLIAALPLSGQVLQTIDFDPPLPDSSMPVQVHLAGVNRDGCVPENPVAHVNGHSIAINFPLHQGGCILVPTPWGERVDLGRLAPGEYDVVVLAAAQFEGVVMGTSHLSVTDANQPFDVFPSVAETAGGRQVQIEVNIDAPLCAPGAAACTEVDAVAVGGKTAQFTVSNERTINVSVPPHAAGPAAIDLKLQGMATMTFTAFRYFDPSAAPDPAAFDRVLFPVMFSGPGAFGSFWLTDAAIENVTTGVVGDWRTVTLANDCPVAAPCSGPVQPRATGYVVVASRERGLLYFPERRHEALLRYGLHVRDSSRSAQDLGTEIPVITPRQTTFDISLLDIPGDTRYRRTLRIYDIDGVERSVQVSVMPMGPLALADTVSVALTTGCTSAVCDAPAYATINLDPVVAKISAPRVRVRVSAPQHDARLWAVVTVTNNDTQHVTAY